MAITSITFFLFVLGTAGVYYLLPRRAQNFWLLLCSYVFHLTWAASFALVLAATTLVNFYIAWGLGAGNKRRKVWLWSGVAFNLGLLIFFRSEAFFIPQFGTFLQALGLAGGEESLAILLPIGLSYYVLQNISYLLDVSRGQMRASRDLVDFGLYLAYFPKLLAGPIERAKTFLPRLNQPRVVDNQVLARALTLVAIGLVRKILVADILISAVPWDVFVEPSGFPAPELWIWLVVYAFYIYNDFAGYTAIVRGISLLFGIELMPNFEFPYFSRNFSEFWNRWHISLSHWLRDYIYFPLSRWMLRIIRARTHLVNLLIPPLVTMLVSGFWHGFSAQMLLWGGLYGFYLAVERWIMIRRPTSAPAVTGVWRQVFSVSVIFVLVSLAWVPFRMDIPVALEYWRGLLLNWQTFDLRYSRTLLMVPFLFALIGFDWIQFKRQGELTFLSWPRWVRAALLGGVFFAVFLLTQRMQADVFIYQGF